MPPAEPSALMIPAGQESVSGREVDRDRERSTQHELVRAVRQLIATAESDLPPAEKLELLCVQVGTLQYWADRLLGPRRASRPSRRRILVRVE